MIICINYWSIMYEFLSDFFGCCCVDWFGFVWCVVVKIFCYVVDGVGVDV